MWGRLLGVTPSNGLAECKQVNILTSSTGLFTCSSLCCRNDEYRHGVAKRKKQRICEMVETMARRNPESCLGRRDRHEKTSEPPTAGRREGGYEAQAKAKVLNTERHCVRATTATENEASLLFGCDSIEGAFTVALRTGFPLLKQRALESHSL